MASFSVPMFVCLLSLFHGLVLVFSAFVSVVVKYQLQPTRTLAAPLFLFTRVHFRRNRRSFNWF